MKKFLGIGSLVFLQIAIVANLQPLAVNATYGFTLPFLYLIAVIGFFIPCTLMVAELATSHPQTGGAYIWAENAFGKRIGFVAVVLIWISNLFWYPSIFSLIAINTAYVFAPALANSKMFIVSCSLMMFWFITLLNCIGVEISSRLSIEFTIIGIIFPILLIMMGGFYWVFTGQPINLSLSQTPLIPHFSNVLGMTFFIGVVTSLFGIELPAVHAGDVKNPHRNFPLSLLISSILLIIMLLLVELSLAIIVTPAKLNLVTGLLDGITSFLLTTNLQHLTKPILLLVLIGNIGSITAWMLGSTRGMYVACKKNNITRLFQLTNSKESPVGVLITEGLIFTLVSAIFLVLPQIIDSFWLLLDVASQISLIYYVILFASCIKLRYMSASSRETFKIPGGFYWLWPIMGLGILTSILAFISGFIAPADLLINDAKTFHIVMLTGLSISFILPLLLFKFRRELPRKHCG